MQGLPEKSVNCCVTSPPYFGLRDYGHAGQIGLEATPDAYVAKMVEVFREVRRVLRDDGTLWLNLGDSYASAWACNRRNEIGSGSLPDGKRANRPNRLIGGLKEKDLIGIPWRVAFALQQPYYDWQIKTEAMRAWVGGIVDGEGCITILETKSSHSESLSYPPTIQVRMCDLEPLDRLVQVVGSSYGKPQHPPSQVAANQRASWQWKVVSEQAANVIAEIYPFLTCKRKQAIVAWNHQAFRSARGNQKRERGDIEKEQFCKTLINSLNQREPVDIPSWMKEPTIAYEPGWYLRQDLIWSKPNPMPESVRDRCTKAHEYIFMLSKSARYYYDADAIAEPLASTSIERLTQANLKNQKGSDRVPGKTNGNMKAVARDIGVGAGARPRKGVPNGAVTTPKQDGHGRRHAGFNQRYFGSDKPYTGESTKDYAAGGAQDASATKARIVDRILSGEICTRNKRSVWTVTTKPFKGAHFATFPPDLIEPCVLAGCPAGGTVLDPFGGAGTTGLVAARHGRSYVLCELNPDYAKMAEERIAADQQKRLEALL